MCGGINNMKKKKIVALLLATSVIATSPALFTSPMMVFAEEAEGTSGEQIEVNTETIATNTSTIVTNAEEGTITTNEGKVNTNYGTIETNTKEGTVDNNNASIITNNGTVVKNEGTGLVESYDTEQNIDTASGNGIKYNLGKVTENNGDILINHGEVTTNKGTIDATQSTSKIETNKGNIKNNHGVIEENIGFITSNETAGTVEKNNNGITNNQGTVIENAKGGVITTNKTDGIVEINNGDIFENYGTVLDNNQVVGMNRESGTIIIEGDGEVEENHGTVKIIVEETTTDEEIDTIVNNTVKNNWGTIDVNKSENDIIKYFGISAYNGLVGPDKYFKPCLDSVKENSTYTFSIPSWCGVDGNVILSKDNTTLKVIGDALETNEDGDYIVPVGTKFKVTGTATFLGKWYKILQSSGAIVEVVQDTSSNDDAPTQPTPVVKDFTTNIGGVEINSWEDVSNVMNTKADIITAEPNSDFKLFKLELSKKQLTIPTSVVSNVATSKVDGLHCFIGDGDAITFIDNGTLGNYVPTDFTHSDRTTDDMKFINFAKPQAIGATVLLSTRVPAKNAPVAIWMFVDGKYELVGFDVSNETGNIAFPISSTGQFVLTY